MSPVGLPCVPVKEADSLERGQKTEEKWATGLPLWAPNYRGWSGGWCIGRLLQDCGRVDGWGGGGGYVLVSEQPTHNRAGVRAAAGGSENRLGDGVAGSAAVESVAVREGGREPQGPWAHPNRTSPHTHTLPRGHWGMTAAHARPYIKCGPCPKQMGRVRDGGSAPGLGSPQNAVGGTLFAMGDRDATRGGQGCMKKQQRRHPQGNSGLWHGCAGGGQHKSAERKWARQWPTRPEAPSCHRRWDTKMPVGRPARSPSPQTWRPTSGRASR